MRGDEPKLKRGKWVPGTSGGSESEPVAAFGASRCRFAATGLGGGLPVVRREVAPRRLPPQAAGWAGLGQSLQPVLPAAPCGPSTGTKSSTRRTPSVIRRADAFLRHDIRAVFALGSGPCDGAVPGRWSPRHKWPVFKTHHGKWLRLDEREEIPIVVGDPAYIDVQYWCRGTPQNPPLEDTSKPATLSGIGVW